jgi:hypothetical protein
VEWKIVLDARAGLVCPKKAELILAAADIAVDAGTMKCSVPQWLDNDS